MGGVSGRACPYITTRARVSRVRVGVGVGGGDHVTV